MKIPAINLNVVNFRANAQNTAPQYVATYGNLAPLAQDTVNFTGGKSPNVAKVAKKAAKEVAETAEKTVNGLRADKVLDKKAYPDFNYNIAIELERGAEVPMAYRRSIKELYYRRFVSPKDAPETPRRFIAGLKYRIKGAPQIADKLIAVADNLKKKAKEVGDDFGVYSIRDAKALLGDILGDRTVLNVFSKKAGATALATSEQILKDGKQILTEIEVYAPVITSIPDHILTKYEKELGIKLMPKDIKMITQPDFFCMATRDSINSLATTARKKYSKLSVDYGKDRANGYIAMHQNYKLPDGSTGEEQTMLKSVEILKDIEDVIYKAKGSKPVISKRVREFLSNSDSPKAKMLLSKITELERRIAPLGDEKETALVAMVDEYTRWAYVGQALKDLPKFRKTATDKFLVAPQELLDKGLGFNQLKPYVKAIADANKMFKEAQPIG